jgi:hypothetical protein
MKIEIKQKEETFPQLMIDECKDYIILMNKDYSGLVLKCFSEADWIKAHYEFHYRIFYRDYVPFNGKITLSNY